MTAKYLAATSPPPDLLAGFEAIREELEVPQHFGAAAMQEARAASRASAVDLPDATDLAFVTIDPASARDLDQALLIQRVGPGYRVHYAIADVPGFVQPGNALDAEVRLRAMTMYSPDRKVPLHPEVLSEGAASLLPDEDRPALVWTVDLDSDAAIRAARVTRQQVRSRAKLSYEAVQQALDKGVADENLALLRDVGLLLQQREADRGGVSLPGAEQEILHEDDTYRLIMREPLLVEGWNAQISLLTGRAAAKIMLAGGVGILRTMPAPTCADIGRVRAVALSLGIDWPEDQTYARIIAWLDPTVPSEAALLNAAPALLRGASYTAFDGEQPSLTTHSAVAAPYAHVTAPLRRLVDRWGLQICLCLCEGTGVPDWVRDSLFDVPDLMAAGTKRARALERANVDLVEAFALQDQVGRTFEAVVLQSREQGSLIQLREPPVIARARGAMPLGQRVGVRLAAVDVSERSVTFVRTDQTVPGV